MTNASKTTRTRYNEREMNARKLIESFFKNFIDKNFEICSTTFNNGLITELIIVSAVFRIFLCVMRDSS